MAQEVKLMGAIYSDVSSVKLPDANDDLHSFTDCSVVTATASDVAQGKVFVASDGTITTGSLMNGNSLSYGLTDGTLPLVGVAKIGQAEVE